ncbi:hypothetical protein S7711_10317 [Stachybotrys chartarum IBT 7711]|uniref:Uncharacterized protein n=1 Tax=Stachybotrys chartarum (strain CBS 109288 / IBT 7711) TaxID=1280523 RepID=A0A084B546_STACB|nr:hypothetical protein S7711_10317 [Stachybotrys chartarum IBT 7711]
MQCRIESSVISKVPLTPSITHIFTKAHKAGHALTLNSILTTREMQLIKRKALEHFALPEMNTTAELLKMRKMNASSSEPPTPRLPTFAGRIRR